mgnify:CR=1 FL=1
MEVKLIRLENTLMEKNDICFIWSDYIRRFSNGKIFDQGRAGDTDIKEALTDSNSYRIKKIYLSKVSGIAR